MKTPAVGWIAQLARVQPAPIPWAGALRAGLAVAAPVAVGLSLGQLAPGLLCSFGALVASLQDHPGTYRARVGRVGIVAASGALGFLLGGLVFGNGVLTVLLVLCAGLVSGIISVLGNVASVASLQFLLYVVVASGVSFGYGSWWTPPLLFLVGAAWALYLSLLAGIGRATVPERVAVAEVYRALATLMDMSGRGSADAARLALTAALTAAYDTVVSYRATAGGRDPRVRRLAALLNAATPLVETTLTLVRDRAIVPMRVCAFTREIAVVLLHGAGSRAGAEGARVLTSTDARGRPDEAAAVPELAALESGLRAVSGILFGEAHDANDPPSRPDVRARMLALRDAVASGPATWQPILRLVLCLGVAELVAFFLPDERPYWVVLTVAVTLKPDFGSVFARAVQRGVGTVVGVLIGSALVAVLPVGVPIVAAIAVLAALLPVSIRRNYGMFATFLTPLIVLLLDLVHHGDEALALARLLDTAVGCAIVLLVGYLPWPSIWRSRSRIGDRVADAADDVLGYLRVSLGTDAGGRQDVRRRTYRRLSDLRTVLQQALAEPPPISTQAAAWWPAIVCLERLTDAVTAVVVRVSLGRPGASVEGSEMVGAFMADFADAVRAQRAPQTLPLPDEAPLAGVVAELRAAHAVLVGPSQG